MVRLCAVFGCGNRSNRDVDKKFFAFPGVRDQRGRPVKGGEERRKLWIQSLRRGDFTESKVRYSTICSDHFVSGQPSTDPLNADYVPSVKMGYEPHTQKPMTSLRRSTRARRPKVPFMEKV